MKFMAYIGYLSTQFSTIMVPYSSDPLAYLSAFLAQTIFPLSQIYVIENNFTIYQISSMRSVVTILLSYSIAKYRNINLDFTINRNFYLLFLKNGFTILWIFVLTLSFYYLTFANIYSINICGALFVFLWDSYLFGMDFNSYQKLGVFLGIFGSLLIINADVLIKTIFSDYQSKSDFHHKSTETIQIMLCSLALLVSNIFMAYGTSIVKRIKIQKDACEINFHFGIMLSFFSAIGCILAPNQEKKQITLYFWATLYSSVPQTIATQLSIISVVLTKNSGIATLFTMVSVIVSYLLDTLRYNQSFNIIAIIGSLLITAGITLTILKKTEIPKYDEERNRQLKAQS